MLQNKNPHGDTHCNNKVMLKKHINLFGYIFISELFWLTMSPEKCMTSIDRLLTKNSYNLILK